VLSSAVSALSTFYQDSLNPFDHDQVEISTVRLLAKLPTIAAYSYKNSIGQPFAYRATRVPTMDWRASGAAVRPAASRIVSQVSGALTDEQ
jgi:citrate synthase